ncbi:MAG: biotin/lipoyl-binding protein [Clostridia bacterium]|nr:biotin/lipoyl-binding protein [Lachnospiraceae bacterium]NCC00572.1 biotin/lipoyl-binding protein [Clostridia bacterium]NCD02000.1 biotin/lipoyl-binding protein [Clostridia bacterium]
MKNYTITVNGKVYDVTVEEGTAAPQQPIQQTSQPAAKPAPKPVASQTSAAGSIVIKSPMPGKIVGVKASVGQNVKKGDVVMILEAMKMENEIVAPEDGTIASVQAAVGTSVEAGTVLASLK